MARVSFLDENGRPELGELAGKFRAGRRGSLLNIYKLLLHTPDVADAWFELFNSVRWRTTLSGRLREIIIIRVANLHRMAYVLRQHIPKLALAEGLTLAECDALADWEPSGLFDPRERAALAFADAMVRAADGVTDTLFDAVRAHFSERETVELTVLVGAYIMHNRVFGTLKIDLEPLSP